MIIRATREFSQNLIIQTVSYEAVKKSLIVPAQELNKIEEDATRVKSNKVSSATLTLEDRKTLRNPTPPSVIWFNDTVQPE